MAQLSEGNCEPAVQVARELRVLLGRLRRRLREVSDTYELTPSQVAVVSLLDLAGAASASDLAAAERIRPQSMAAILAALDERGWLQRRLDPDDGRRQLISLSPLARESLHEGRQVRVEWLARALQDRYTDAERHTITDALALLDRLTQP